MFAITGLNIIEVLEQETKKLGGDTKVTVTERLLGLVNVESAIVEEEPVGIVQDVPST